MTPRGKRAAGRAAQVAVRCGAAALETPGRTEVAPLARDPRFAARALLARALAAGFHVAALAVSAAVLAVPAATWSAHPLAATACAGAAALLLASAASVRAPRLSASGPELTAADQPGLVALVDRVASRLGAPPPDRIWLGPEVIAAAGETGGRLGLGGDRVLELGLGLVAVQTVSELEAMVAHELAHVAAGRARAAGAVHRARVAVGRALAAQHGAPLAWPFRLWAALLLRATGRIAHREEHRADRAAAAVAGPAALASAVAGAARSGLLFRAFLEEEVAPLLARGHRPENLYDGFRAYAEELAEQGRTARLDEALTRQPPDPEGTHPPLAARLAALAALPVPATSRDDRPARSLLANPERLERELSARLAARLAGGRALEPVRWSEVAGRVHGPRVSAEAQAFAARIAGEYGGPARPGAALQALVATLRRAHDEAAARVLDPGLAGVPDRERAVRIEAVVTRALGTLLAVVLVERGGTFRSEPGRPLEVAIGQDVIAPFRLAAEAIADRARLDELERRTADLA